MDNKDVIHDLKLIKDFFEENSGAYPICLEYAIKALEREEKEINDGKDIYN